uniref:Uncharacterized protein n=1 Tax=Knipowitschia caucasica TaxID=637954 RepID=A0AAV2LII6_KNICA
MPAVHSSDCWVFTHLEHESVEMEDAVIAVEQSPKRTGALSRSLDVLRFAQTAHLRTARRVSASLRLIRVMTLCLHIAPGAGGDGDDPPGGKGKKTSRTSSSSGSQLLLPQICVNTLGLKS